MDYMEIFRCASQGREHPATYVDRIGVSELVSFY